MGAVMPKTGAPVHAGPRLASRGDFTVIDCASCGFAHAMPLPDEAALSTVYSHDYYATEKPLYLERYEQDRAWWLDVYADRLATVEAATGIRGGTALDIGCGPGLFLDAARDRGWRVEGIEPSRQAAAHARGLGHAVHDGFFDPAMAATLAPVDLIHMALVLEHLPDPAAILSTARGLLKPGGAVCVVVPNDFNPLQAAALQQGVEPYWVAPPHHLNYFTPHSLGRLLQACGFAVVERTATFRWSCSC
ncbi:MAG: class I SAM-dependent methyltransferase [Alphaproteobacteria bacterium]